MTALGFPRNYVIHKLLRHKGYDSNNASFPWTNDKGKESKEHLKMNNAQNMH